MLQRILIRADADNQIGYGHVMRCLALAEGLTEQNFDITFLTNASKTPLKSKLKASPITVSETKGLTLNSTALMRKHDAVLTNQIAQDQNADAIIVDHYQTDLAWEQSQELPLIVIDDLPERVHACDLILDQNLSLTTPQYQYAIGHKPIVLFGPKYALLRKEFRSGKIANPSTIPNKILISPGGTDPQNAANWILKTLNTLNKNIHAILAVSSSSPWVEEIENLATRLKYQVDIHYDATNMSDLMLQTRFTIGAAGSSSWERCALGVPSIAFSVAPNQDRLVQALSASGAAHAVNLKDDGELKSAVNLLISDAAALKDIASKAHGICDGKGVSRVISHIKRLL